MLTLKQNKEFEEKLGMDSQKVEILDVSLAKLRDEVKKCKGEAVVLGGNDKLNRLALEIKKIDVLLSPEANDKEDNVHYRKSGLNQVLCKLAKQNDIAIGFDFARLLRSQGKERGKILGKMFFNYKICKKYGVKMVFSSFAKDKFELRNGDSMRVFERILEKYAKDL
jgi:RNase P/RNase MRP subunit p30